MCHERIEPGAALSSKHKNKVAVVGYYADFDLRGPTTINYNDNGQAKSQVVKGRLLADICIGQEECNHISVKLQQSATGLGLIYTPFG